MDDGIEEDTTRIVLHSGRQHASPAIRVLREQQWRRVILKKVVHVGANGEWIQGEYMPQPVCGNGN